MDKMKQKISQYREGKYIELIEREIINIVNNTNKTDGFATAGFVLSLVSFFCCGFTSVIALIFSIVGITISPIITWIASVLYEKLEGRRI